jgi:hypothetical protein
VELVQTSNGQCAALVAALTLMYILFSFNVLPRAIFFLSSFSTFYLISASPCESIAESSQSCSDAPVQLSGKLGLRLIEFCSFPVSSSAASHGDIDVSHVHHRLLNA